MREIRVEFQLLLNLIKGSTGTDQQKQLFQRRAPSRPAFPPEPASSSLSKSARPSSAGYSINATGFPSSTRH
jgi:hypothetical protein